ncbi:MAG: hypothetical protein RIS17_662 [Pseudomonadota bacterium]|jgi:hypothetical protein
MLSCALIAATLAAAAPGSTVTTGPVRCPARVSLLNRNYNGVTLDATGAVFAEGIGMRNVQGLTIKGGTWGRRDADTLNLHVIRADAVTDVTIAGTTVLGNANLKGGGISVQPGSQRVTIRDNRLHGHMLGIGVRESSDILIARNAITGSTSDGINSVGNQRVIITNNQCSEFTKIYPAHPDCIQLWSIVGQPLQADVYVINNAAIGDMQGILSSDPKTVSGRRLFFHGNYLAVTYSHTLTCGGCVESVAMDNVLASYPGSYFGIGSLKGFDHISNRVARNVMRDGVKALPARSWSSFVPPISDRVGNRYDRRWMGGETTQTPG